MAARSIAQSLKQYGRGVAGGLLVSLPLLYTMEMWQTGMVAHPRRLIGYVLATFVLLLGYNRYAGLRRDASFTEVVIDSIEEMGLGLLLAALFLWLIGRLRFDLGPIAVLGEVVVGAMPVAIGVSVGTAQLGGGEGGEKDSAGALDEKHFGGQLLMAGCGAVLFAANVAPTDEIVLIAVSLGPGKLLGLALVSLALAALILYYTEFIGMQRFVRAESTGHVARGTVTTYAVALLTSALMLWFFGRFDGLALMTCVAETVVLGVAATLGASAGRLLLQ